MTDENPENPKQLRSIKEPIVGTKGFLGIFKSKLMSQQMIDDRAPALLIMNVDGQDELVFGAESGKMEYNDPVEHKKKDLYLRPDKLRRLRIGDLEIPYWNHYVKETYSYPHTPKLDLEAFSMNIEGIYQSLKNYMDSKKFRDKDLYMYYLKIAAWVAGITMGLYLGVPWIVDLLDIPIVLPAWWTGAQPIIQNITSNISNTTTYIDPTTGAIIRG